MTNTIRRIPCEWVIPTTKGPRHCSFQGSVTVLGHHYCKTHGKHARKVMPTEGQVQGATLAAEQRLATLRVARVPAPKPVHNTTAPITPTAESLEVAQAILTLAKEGASENAVAFLIDGFVSNVMRRALTQSARVA